MWLALRSRKRTFPEIFLGPFQLLLPPLGEPLCGILLPYIHFASVWHLWKWNHTTSSTQRYPYEIYSYVYL